MKLRVLDLFSGIGGFSLGLERARLEGAEYDGFETVAFCEIEEFPRKVLAKHWPHVPCYRDVRELTAERLAADGIAVDVITGGFPCQDISTSGRKAGIGQGTRSGLYAEVLRIACNIRPKFIILENVANLLSGPSEQPGGWFGRIFGDLAELGFDAEWANIPAAALGAPHRRERVWIVAHPSQIRHAGEFFRWDCAPRNEEWEAGASLLPPYHDGMGDAPDSYTLRNGDGFSEGVAKLNALGNAVVPQIPELIGNAILQSLAERRAA